MIRVQRSSERGHFEHGWLDTYHTFSFGDYYDPKMMGFRALRVLNEDWVAPSMGFGRHGHRDMEIITYVISGALRHRDSLGTSADVVPGEVQRMTAGTGVLHSEMNPSTTEPVHLLQIWIVPDKDGYEPGYEQRVFAESPGWRLLASPDGRDGSLTVRQDVSMFDARLEPGVSLRHDLAPGRHAWLQVTRGTLNLGNQTLDAGDGAAVSEDVALTVTSEKGADLLLFDLA